MLLHHPAANGECFHPIRPFKVTTTQFICSTIEEALFGEFTKKKKHAKFASFIFNQSIEYSRSRLIEWFSNPNFDLKVAVDVLKSRFIEVEDLISPSIDGEMRKLIAKLARRYPKHEYNLGLNPEHGITDVNPPVWELRGTLNPRVYSYLSTVWLRVNGAMALMEYSENISHKKCLMFINQHIPVMRYLDSLNDPSDEHINIHTLCSLYQPLGKSYFDEDRNTIKVVSERVSSRLYPLEIILKKYPLYNWTIETIRPNVQTIEAEGYLLKPEWQSDPVLLACLAIMVQCKQLHKVEEDSSTRDALWFYHHCFVDYVFNYPQTDNLYPHDNRCFTGYDLPDVYHVLVLIPLWDKENSPNFPLGKFIQKSLPFAGARRTLINQTDKNISDIAFWKIFSSVFFCLLMDTYPEHVSKNRERCFNLSKLLDIMTLVTDKEKLRESLSRKSFKGTEKENDKGCYIVFTAFRMWILMNTYNQKHYKDGIANCFDFDSFEAQIVDMAKTIRNSDFALKDVFAESREFLSKNNKNFKSVVYRYRKNNIVDTLLDQMMNSLEKNLFKELDRWNKKVKKYEKTFSEKLADAKYTVSELSYEIPVAIKTNILNTMIRMKRSEFMSPLSLSILRDERFGGVSEFTIVNVLKLIEIYYESVKPKDFENCASLFECSKDFKIVSWYFHVVQILDKIDFDPLTITMIEKIDNALMTEKFTLYPGQSLPLSVFDVFFTICCGKIKTLTGSDKYGHEGIAYNIDQNVYQCAKIHKKILNDDFDEFAFSEFEKQKKDARKQRKEFNFLPCKNNPVLSVSLRGFILIYEKKRFLHCPSCGSFHQFKWTGFKKDTYACETCRRKQELHITCHVCYEPATVTKVVENPLAIGDVFQNLYFCKKHCKDGNEIIKSI